MDCVLEYLEGQLHQVVTLERGVRAGHGDDLGFLHQKVFGSIQPTPQQLEGPELLQMYGEIQRNENVIEKLHEKQQLMEIGMNFNPF